eukprot:9662807-Lingulodinium_polyedra.AAC.1
MPDATRVGVCGPSVAEEAQGDAGAALRPQCGGRRWRARASCRRPPCHDPALMKCLPMARPWADEVV